MGDTPQGSKEHNTKAKEKTYSKILVTIQEHLPTPLPTHIRRHLLKLTRRALLLNLHRLFRDFIRKQPRRVPPPSKNKLRIRLLRLDNRLLNLLMNRCLNRTHKPRPHINALSAQTQRRRQPLPVRKTTRRNERHAERLACAAQQNEVGDVALADMAGALEPVDGQEIHTELDSRLRVPNASALVQDDAASGFQLLDHGARAVARGLDDVDPFFDYHAGVGTVVRGNERGEEG